MNQAKLAEARRLYHHVCNGGTLTPDDVSFMVVALEEAYEQAEVDRLRAKKKAIHDDLFKDICKAIDEIKEHEKRTDAQHERRSDPRNA